MALNVGRPKAILIAGPTASGKSAAALDLAQRLGGAVINADSMQVYRELAVLTARPSKTEMLLAPHRLYGTVPASESYSAAALSKMRRALCARRQARDMCRSSSAAPASISRRSPKV